MGFALGVLLASVTFFLWSAVSWMALPWQRGVFKPFAREDALLPFLAEQAPASGIYGYPAEPKHPRGATREEREAIDRKAFEQIQRGPLVFAVVSREGFPSYSALMVRAFLGNLVVSAIFAWMLAQTTGLSYGERVAFLLLAGVAAGIACRIPDWNWHRFPWNYTLIHIASLAAGWLLSGLVLAWFVRGRA
jgi:hypothetical protein